MTQILYLVILEKRTPLRGHGECYDYLMFEFTSLPNLPVSSSSWLPSDAIVSWPSVQEAEREPSLVAESQVRWEVKVRLGEVRLDSRK